MAVNDTYEVYAVKYATLKRTLADNFIGGDPHESGSDLDYFVWVIRNAARTIVVDTGYNAVSAKKRGRTFLRTPAEGLGLLNIDAARVPDVIITHMHYDHLGNAGEFTDARYHLQDQEMHFATGRHMAQGIFAHGYEVEEVCDLVRATFRGKVQYHNGEADIAPGISVHLIGGHTMGIQAVRVKTRVGAIVLASDATHFYANMDQVKPFPIVFHIGDMVQGFRKLRELADDPQFIVPGHDPLVMQRYASAGAGMDGIVARLDAEPKLR